MWPVTSSRPRRSACSDWDLNPRESERGKARPGESWPIRISVSFRTWPSGHLPVFSEAGGAAREACSSPGQSFLPFARFEELLVADGACWLAVSCAERFSHVSVLRPRWHLAAEFLGRHRSPRDNVQFLPAGAPHLAGGDRLEPASLYVRCVRWAARAEIAVDLGEETFFASVGFESSGFLLVMRL